MVSMPTLHFFRWTDQLKNSDHEIYWFDIVDGSPTKKLPWVKKVNGWKVRYPYAKGRYFLKKKSPFIYKIIKPLFERNTAKEFEKALDRIKPDVVHSFVLYISCAPIYSIMLKNKSLPWIYSSWGSDLYYFQNLPKYLKEIKTVLPRVNYMFSDCLRDKQLAEKYGFSGHYLGSYPGGGGYDLQTYDNYIAAVEKRNIILIKGYQGRSGRALNVLKAIEQIIDFLKPYKIVVFGADDEVVRFVKHSSVINKNDNLEILPLSQFLPHSEIMQLMGKSLIYIGNSNSDGMPNTLLEAIIMGAFPIQSNPGGATEEIIVHGKNGLIISDHNNSDEIASLLKEAITNKELLNSAFRINQSETKLKFDRNHISNEVIKKYGLVGK